MIFRSIILGVLLFQCAFHAQCSFECPPLSSDPNYPVDPNDYIDDPNILENGLFECGDPNNLTPYGTVYDLEPPIFWERIPEPCSMDDCYVELLSYFDPPESTVDWKITEPYQGNRFVLLSTGHPANTGVDHLKSSTISQKIFVDEGDTITGAYFFGTSDWWPSWNDYAEIWLEPVDPNNGEPNEIRLAHCDVVFVGDSASTQGKSPQTNGWISFSHTIDPNEAGTYFLLCKVEDLEDTSVDSYLAVDGLRICRGGKPLSDLNNDCKVDLIDYSILSEAWLSFCPYPPIGDPNFPGEPNDYPDPPSDPNILHSCELADIDNSWFVDPNDLMIMSNEWLIDHPSE
jgi:hypothetical protein